MCSPTGEPAPSATVDAAITHDECALASDPRKTMAAKYGDRARRHLTDGLARQTSGAA
jgi:hypothetical protein